jgi:hypothetical protein
MRNIGGASSTETTVFRRGSCDTRRDVVSNSDAPREAATSTGEEPLFRSGVRPTGRPPGPDGRPPTRPPTARVSLRPSANPLPIEPLSLDEDALALLRFTDSLEDESVAMFWVGVAGRSQRARARARGWVGGGRGLSPWAFRLWIRWAMAVSATRVLLVLDALRAQARAHRGRAQQRAARARPRHARLDEGPRRGSSDPALLVGGIRVTLEAVARGAPEPSAAERNILSTRFASTSSARPRTRAARRCTRSPRSTPRRQCSRRSPSPSSTLLLLDADLRGEWDPALGRVRAHAVVAQRPALGLRGRRGAQRSARRGCSARSRRTPQCVEGLPELAQRAVREALPKSIAHNRFSVWSRCARAAGKLAGVLPGVAPLLQAMPRADERAHRSTSRARPRWAACRSSRPRCSPSAERCSINRRPSRGSSRRSPSRCPISATGSRRQVDRDGARARGARRARDVGAARDLGCASCPRDRRTSRTPRAGSRSRSRR